MTNRQLKRLVSRTAKELERLRQADIDLACLAVCVTAIGASEPKMQRATIKYLWDRFIAHPTPKSEVAK